MDEEETGLRDATGQRAEAAPGPRTFPTARFCNIVLPSDFRMCLPILFFELISIGMSFGVLPKATTDFFGKEDALIITAMFGALKGFLAFFASPIHGSISDQVGRKWVIFICSMLTLLPLCLLVFTTNLWLFVILDSLAGLFNATHAVVYAYIVDCNPASRAKNFGLANATFGASLVVGPMLGVVIYSQLGFSAVFVAVSLLTACNGVYVATMLPESLPGPKPWRELRRADLALCRVTVLWKAPMLRQFGVIAFCYFITASGFVATLLMYLSTQLDFSVLETGLFCAVFGVVEALSSGVLIRYAVPRYGERRVIMMAMGSQMLMGIAFAMAHTKAGAFFALVFCLLTPMCHPALLALVSAAVERPAEQGTVQGAVNGIKSLCGALAPALFGGVLRLCQHTGSPGAAYYLAVPFGLAGVVVAYRLPEDPRSTQGALHSFQQVEQEDQLHDELLLANDVGDGGQDELMQDEDVFRAEPDIDPYTGSFATEDTFQAHEINEFQPTGAAVALEAAEPDTAFLGDSHDYDF